MGFITAGSISTPCASMASSRAQKLTPSINAVTPVLLSGVAGFLKPELAAKFGKSNASTTYFDVHSLVSISLPSMLNTASLILSGLICVLFSACSPLKDHSLTPAGALILV